MLHEMSSSRRACRSKTDVLCYICGEYTIVPNRNPVTKFIKRAYHTYFGTKLGDQDNAWVPHMVCKTCTEYLRRWTNDKKSCLKFGFPIAWREPANHGTDCYFCVIYVTGISRKNWNSLKYPDLQSARRSAAHYDEIPVPVFGGLPDISDKDSSGVEDNEEEASLDDDAPHHFPQMELNDLVRDLGMSKCFAELLASRLKKNNSLSNSARITFYRNRHKENRWFFLYEEKDFAYRTDIAQLLHKLGVPQYQPEDWRLFIDSSKRSLKGVVLYNDNRFAYVPLAHSITLKEKHEAVKYVLEKVRYDQHEWDICVEPKMMNLLMGQQSGFTNK